MRPLPAKRTTSQFIDWFSYLPFFCAVGMFGAIFVGTFTSRTVLVRNLQVDSDMSQAIAPVQLVPQPIGATRITANAQLGSNQWVTYEIQIKDQQGKVIASAIKPGWNESGTWREEGESGVWSEADTEGVIDFRAIGAETITIAIQVLDYTDTVGKDIDRPVPIQLRIATGVVDDRYLWPGAMGTAILAVLAFASLPTSGKKVLGKSIRDSDIRNRVTCGGANRLLKVNIKVAADSTTPGHVYARLVINDGNGEQLYNEKLLLELQRSTDDKNRILWASGSLTRFFVLEPRASYGFHVEITPDRSIDRTTLIIREGSHTIFPVPVTFLKSTEG